MSHPFDLASRENHPQDTIIESSGLKIGGRNFALIAGPCAVENEEQMHRIGALLRKHDVPLMRGGAYKPRTSPYRFQGLGLDGLKLMREVADTYGLQVVTEIMDYSLIDEVYAYADILQVGARNMKNYHFLKLLGETDKPILLKRGMDATIEEWLLAAEYILLGGNQEVILCERGIRTFDDSVRNTFDTVSIPLVQSLSHLPVIADPSQGTGNRQLVEAASMAAVAAGAQGLMIEVHNEPETALSDGPQSLYPEQFDQLLIRLEGLLKWAGKLHWKQNTSKEVVEEKAEIQP